MGRITYAAAGTAALAEEMRRDPTVFEFCTDATGSLLEEFGPTRIRTTPITENTITGMADGAAGSGRRKRARRGGETPLDDAEATNAVCPRSETTVPAAGAYACLRRAREAVLVQPSAASAPCRM